MMRFLLYKGNNNNYQNNKRPMKTNNMSIIHESDNDDEDNKSNYSFISNINRVKNYLINKENRDFCFNILKVIIIGILLLIMLSYILRFSISIAKRISQEYDGMINPRTILFDFIRGFLRGLFNGIIDGLISLIKGNNN